MKKIVYSLAIVSVLASLAVWQKVSAEDLPLTTTAAPLPPVVNSNEMPKVKSELYNELLRKPKPPITTTSAVVTERQKNDKLEKIATPTQIPLYDKIEKVGNTLWGIKKEVSDQLNRDKQPLNADGTTKTDSQIGTEGKMPANDRLLNNTTTDKLEKIATPDQISMYEKIKKVGTALWGIKKEASNIIKPKPVVVTAETSACVISAIDVKDKALQEKVGTAADSLKTAIGLRSTCQQQAVKSTERQKDYLDACVKVFKDEHKKINETARKAQNDIWNTYKTSLKSCRPTTATTTPSTFSTESVKVDQGNIMIEDGSESMMDTVLKVGQE